MRGVSGKRTAPPRRHKTICQLWRNASSCPTLIFGAARLHARSPGTHPLSHSTILIFTHHMLKNVRKEDCIKLFKTCHPQPRCVYTSSHLISCATSHTHTHTAHLNTGSQENILFLRLVYRSISFQLRASEIKIQMNIERTKS